MHTESDVVVVATSWPEFNGIAAAKWTRPSNEKPRTVIDCWRSLQFLRNRREYITSGWVWARGSHEFQPPLASGAADHLRDPEKIRRTHRRHPAKCHPSWTRMSPKPQILLFGTEPGTAEVARNSAAPRSQHQVQPVGYSAGQRPFEQAEKLSRSPVLCYVNSDIILFDDFPQA